MSWLEIFLIGYVGWVGGILLTGWIISKIVAAYEKRRKIK